MTLELIIFGYFLVTTLLLIYLYQDRNYWKKAYQNVAMDSYSLERIRIFFKTLHPVIHMMYDIVDQLNEKKGAPATDYRFQLRFLLWWKFFKPGSLETAIRWLNNSPKLQELLQAPAKPYTRFSFYRFRKKLGAKALSQMCLLILAKFIKMGILDLSQLAIDSFPIESFLNTAKSLRMTKFDPDYATKFFNELELDKIVQLLPVPHRKTIPYIDKLKFLIHHYLWNAPSVDKAHQLVFGKMSRKDVMKLEHEWKTANTYRSFVKMLKQRPNFPVIEQTIIAEVRRVLQILEPKRKFSKIKTLDGLKVLLQNFSRQIDHGSSLAYCSAKHRTFLGRGGLVIATKVMEIPILIQLTSKYKQSDCSILHFLATLQHAYGRLLEGVKIFGDGEFVTQLIKDAITSVLKAKAVVDSYGNSQNSIKFSKGQRHVRILIERVIGRLETNFQIEHPQCLGNDAVDFHTQLCWLCDLLQVQYNLTRGNKTHPHAICEIRG